MHTRQSYRPTQWSRPSFSHSKFVENSDDLLIPETKDHMHTHFFQIQKFLLRIDDQSFVICISSTACGKDPKL